MENELKWHNLNENSKDLPDAMCDVLAHSETEGYIIAYYDPQADLFYDSYTNDYGFTDIECWMELPKLPK